jgi:ABC-type multidrug transport system fused ATPase/permease subunit
MSRLSSRELKLTLSIQERGKRMAVSNVALFGAAFLTPVIVGKMTVTIGWQWSFYFVAIFLAASLPLMIFFVPETAYRRSDDLNTDFKHKPGHSESTDSHLALHDAVNDESKAFVPETGAAHGASRTEVTATPIPQEKDSFLRSLRIFTGRKTDERFWKLLLRPFPLFLHPGILWACLIQGVVIGWAVFIGVILALVFEGPPLWFHEDQTGYLYSGAFIGSMIGLVLAGVLTDSMTKFMVKLNRGKYEPEFRILLVVFQLVFACMGLYGFGWTASNTMKYHWLLPDVFFAFVIIGMVMGAVAASLYIVDAHRMLQPSPVMFQVTSLMVTGEIAIEAFTCLLIFKNMFSFVLTFFAYDWMAYGGVKHTMIVLGSIQAGICCLSIPMCKFSPRR